MASRCALCQREGPVTFHHLVPRSMHRKKRWRRRLTREEMREGVDLCRDCHDAVHRFVPEKVLAEEYRTLEALRAHAEIARFVEWVRHRSGRHRMRRGPVKRR